MRALASILVGLCVLSCTPAQQGHVRTALDINQCANAVVMRHIDAGDDFKNVAVLAVIAGEIASECIPTQKDGA